VAALPGGRLVVNFANRKNAPFLFSTRIGTPPNLCPISSSAYDICQQHRICWFKSGARNHLQANRSLGFCFEILI
jgi:hypothetical protein